MKFSTEIQNQVVSIEILEKISIKSINDLLDIRIDGISKKIDSDDLVYLPINKSDNEIGQFKLNNGMIFSLEDSLNIKKMYLDWEANILKKASILFKIPNGKDDNSAGVSRFNPYFHAAVNKMAREFNCEWLGFGSFLSDREMEFSYQYCAFHPSALELISSRLSESRFKDRALISSEMFDLLLENAMKHVTGYRDELRYKKFAKKNGLTYVKEFKFLIEYDHILDCDLSTEDIDFQFKDGTGGFLDILNP